MACKEMDESPGELRSIIYGVVDKLWRYSVSRASKQSSDLTAEEIAALREEILLNAIEVLNKQLLYDARYIRILKL